MKLVLEQVTDKVRQLSAPLGGRPCLHLCGDGFSSGP